MVNWRRAANGIADGAEDAGFQIGEAAYVVDDRRAQFVICGIPSLRSENWGTRTRNGLYIQKKAVDGEVAALDVFFGAQGVANGVGMATVGVRSIGAEGGDLGEGGLTVDFSRD